jgi:hypothetical protein
MTNVRARILGDEKESRAVEARADVTGEDGAAFRVNGAMAPC